ncbi:MAG TPA: tyrosine-type recombinase/integrase [Ktedonobacteraceae bacterium]|nr:tyrosine-type recombinase/integrase [Ktedonobacteraceae bacterium]
MAKKKRLLYGKGSVFQRSNGRWVAKFLVEETGKYKLLYASSEKEAYEKLDKALYDQRQGKLAAGPQRKLGDYLTQWLEEVQKDKLRTSSYVKYKKIIDTYINPALGHVYLQKLTPQQVQAFYNKKRSQGLSPKSINLIHGVLHNALDNAVKWSLVARNVCDLVKPSKVVKPEIQPLTIEQAQQLLNVARGHRIETLLTLALTTGMRRGELLALRWADIDFNRNSLQVRHTVDFIAKHGYVENEPKTESGKRHIALPPFIVEMLKSHRIQQLELRRKVGEAWQESDLVFTGLRGGYLNPRYVVKLFDKLLKEAGLPHIRFHDLRHSAATLLLSMGVEMKVIQEILGHSNIAMTADVYSHVSLSMQKVAMSKWDTAFGDEKSSG